MKPDMQLLAATWARVASKPEGFTCSEAAVLSQAAVGGTVFGYWSDDNPSATLGQDEGGHDFLLVDEYILDFWAAAYEGKKPIYHLVDDAQEISLLYGDRSKWTVVQPA